MCFTHCTKTNIPECATNNNCSFSCLLRWLGHIKRCDICVQHTISGCLNPHCRKIILLWQLRCDIIEFMINEDIRPCDVTFMEHTQTLQHLFLLDYNAIKYEGENKRTIQLFTLLKFFRDSLMRCQLLDERLDQHLQIRLVQLLK